MNSTEQAAQPLHLQPQPVSVLGLWATWAAVGLCAVAMIAGRWTINLAMAPMWVGLLAIVPALILRRGARKVPLGFLLVFTAAMAVISLLLARAATGDDAAGVGATRVGMTVVAAWLALVAFAVAAVATYLLPANTDAIASARVQARIDAGIAATQQRALAEQAGEPTALALDLSVIHHGRTWNSMAVGGAVVMFVLPFVAQVFGHIALSQIKKSGERGKALAVVAIIVGWTSLLAFAIGTAINAAN